MSVRRRFGTGALGVLALTASALLGALGPIGCSGGDEANTEACVSTEQYFATNVWVPVLNAKCNACHNPQGQAKNSNFILKPSSEAGFLQANMATVRELAALQKDGQSWLLLKPTAAVSHGGGVQIEPGSADYKALERLVQMFGEGNSCPNTAVQSLQLIEQAEPRETLRKASLSLAGRLPNAEEAKWVDQHGLAGVRNVLDKMMHEQAFYDRIKEIFNDKFLTDRYLPGDRATNLLDEDDYPNRYWYKDFDRTKELFGDTPTETIRKYSNEAVAQEALELITHVIRNNRPFTEILTADYMVVNPYSAQVYGLQGLNFQNPSNPKEFVEARIPNVPHAGVLSSSMMLTRFPTTNTNRNRHRAAKVYLFFLGTDILKAAEQPLDPAKAEEASPNPTRNSPECTVCHANIDPVAGAFQKWNSQGRFRPESEWFDEMFPPGFGKETMNPAEYNNGLQWLGQRLANDPRFALSMLYIVYEGLTGQAPLKPGDQTAPNFNNQFKGYLAQSEVFAKIAEKFKASNYDFRVLVKELVMSPYYRAKNAVRALTPEESASVSGIGTARLLTPEMLDRKIDAVFGRGWRNGSGVGYLNASYEYRIFYGGIDSDSVITRVTSPNGIMASVQERMANEMACGLIANDFALKQDTRRLFPKVVLKTKPLDDLGNPIPAGEAAVRENIVHLNKLIFGTDLAPDSPEVDRAFALFAETFKELNAKGETELTWQCQAREDVNTGKDLPQGSTKEPLADDVWPRAVRSDENFTVRAWMAVLSYMLQDYRFLYE